MGTPGFKEDQAGYAVDDHRSLIGQIRRLADAGPAYQIMDVDAQGNVIIEIIETDERVTSPLADVLDDPIAETIP